MGVLHYDQNIMSLQELGDSDNGENQTPVELKRQRKKKIHYVVHDRATPTKRKLGVRQARRSENLNFLMTFLEGQEDGNDYDSLNVNEPSSSVFSELFNEREKMKIWNDFVNSSEEEQERFLDSQETFGVSEDKWEEEAMEKEGFTIIDRRQVHPCFSAEECFKQIDSHLRSLLRKRHLPLGALSHLEEEVVGFFEEWPNSVYIVQLESGYQRLLMHAICQYLSLYSRSFDDNLGKRKTHVENKNDGFHAPDVLLSNYLSKLH